MLTKHINTPLRSSFVAARAIHASSSRLQTKPAESKAKETPAGNETPNNKPLGPLNRPLGVRQRPTTEVKSRTERLKELLDGETRMAQRRHLIKEASVGYFHDLNMTRQHGGKTWIAPSVLIREDKALYLPNINGTSISTGENKDTTTMCFGRVTVLAMLGTQMSEIHAKAFTTPTVQRYNDNPLFQYVQINLQENVLKSMLVKLYAKKLLAAVPKEQQANYLISKQNIEYLRDPLGMTNSRVGYVFLIDENLKVRWGGCADPTTEEIQALESCTGVLLKRLEDKVSKESPESKPAAGDSPDAAGDVPASYTAAPYFSDRP